MKYAPEEYNLVVKFINKAKADFLNARKEDIEMLKDNNLMPLAALYETLSRIRYSQDCKESYFHKLILDCEDLVETKKNSLNASTERVMQIIENNIFIAHLNNYVDSVLTDLNLCLFIIRRVQRWLEKEARSFTPSEVLARLRVLLSTSSADPEFVRVNALELDRFNLKAKAKSKTTSERTVSAAGTLREKSVATKKSADHDVAEAINILNSSAKNFYINKPELKPPEHLDNNPTIPDIEQPEGLLLQEPAETEDQNKHFKDAQGLPYDPRARFGVLEDEYTEYDPHMTKYEAVLPEKFYVREIDGQSPSKKEKWFVRPHHVETLTRHPYSKWDNLLNTKYYSFYERQGEKNQPKDKMRLLANDAIGYIEQHVDKLKKKETVETRETRGKSLYLRSRRGRDAVQKLEKSAAEVKR
eukprot:TRINITY_DN1165_c0_g3_i4.p1 TRINITY_DN1165_c0_g3~~TRINITY_DN1165_c0_g3_i4.p1  ORF type:complete len:415 (+),score=121.13 TRINITY_DN1165_c0_g3_i4:128-1372(+)